MKAVDNWFLEVVPSLTDAYSRPADEKQPLGDRWLLSTNLRESRTMTEDTSVKPALECTATLSDWDGYRESENPPTFVGGCMPVGTSDVADYVVMRFSIAFQLEEESMPVPLESFSVDYLRWQPFQDDTVDGSTNLAADDGSIEVPHSLDSKRTHQSRGNSSWHSVRTASRSASSRPGNYQSRGTDDARSHRRVGGGDQTASTMRSSKNASVASTGQSCSQAIEDPTS